MGDILAAAIQMQSTDAVDKNLEASLRLVHSAIKSGATLISLPENYAFLGSEADKRALAHGLEGHPFLTPLQSVAKDSKVSILAGSIPKPVMTRTGPIIRAYS